MDCCLVEKRSVFVENALNRSAENQKELVDMESGVLEGEYKETRGWIKTFASNYSLYFA